MKKFVLLAALAGFGSPVFAQLQKGFFMVGGNLGYNHRTWKPENQFSAFAQTGDEEYKTLYVDPTIGLFLSNKWAAGLSVQIMQQNRNTKVTGLPELSNTRSTQTAGIFVRRYVRTPSEQFAFFTHFTAGYTRGKQQVQELVNYQARPNVVTTRYTLSGMQALLQPGFVFFPWSRFGLELQWGELGYRTLKSKADTPPVTILDRGTIKEKEIGVDFGLSTLRIGGTFYLGWPGGKKREPTGVEDVH